MRATDAGFAGEGLGRQVRRVPHGERQVEKERLAGGVLALHEVDRFVGEHVVDFGAHLRRVRFELVQRANGFINFIATGGSESFVREYSGRVYDIPPERVCGTAQANRFGYAKDGKPILTQEPKLVLNNLEAGKIENFWLLYGRRPQLAFGNSSSDDQQMLEYVKAGSGLNRGRSRNSTRSCFRRIAR